LIEGMLLRWSRWAIYVLKHDVRRQADDVEVAFSLRALEGQRRAPQNKRSMFRLTQRAVTGFTTELGPSLQVPDTHAH
jgi:hypothetical protein